MVQTANPSDAVVEERVMSSPDREKERELLRKIDGFTKKRDRKSALAEQIHKRLLELNLKQLKKILKRIEK